MKKINKIRKDNLFLLMAGTGDNLVSTSRRTGISRSTIHKVAHGTDVSSEMIRKIETAFNMPFGWMDKESEESDTPLYSRIIVQKTFEMIHKDTEILELFNELNSDGQTDLFDMLYILNSDPNNIMTPATLSSLAKRYERRKTNEETQKDTGQRT